MNAGPRGQRRAHRTRRCGASPGSYERCDLASVRLGSHISAPLIHRVLCASKVAKRGEVTHDVPAVPAIPARLPRGAGSLPGPQPGWPAGSSFHVSLGALRGPKESQLLSQRCSQAPSFLELAHNKESVGQAEGQL